MPLVLYMKYNIQQLINKLKVRFNVWCPFYHRRQEIGIFCNKCVPDIALHEDT